MANAAFVLLQEFANEEWAVLCLQSEFLEKEQRVISELNRRCHPDNIEIDSDLALDILNVQHKQRGNRKGYHI